MRYEDLEGRRSYDRGTPVPRTDKTSDDIKVVTPVTGFVYINGLVTCLITVHILRVILLIFKFLILIID